MKEITNKNLWIEPNIQGNDLFDAIDQAINLHQVQLISTTKERIGNTDKFRPCVRFKLAGHSILWAYESEGGRDKAYNKIMALLSPTSI